MRASIASNDFLAQRRIALVGVSRKPDDFSRHVLRELLRRHYDVVPVGRKGGRLDGQACFSRVQDIVPPVDGALLMIPPEVTEQVVRECAAAGIRRVWMHRGIGQGAVSARAAAFCRERGISVIEGGCPLMFLPASGFVHGLHGFLLKLTGRYAASH